MINSLLKLEPKHTIFKPYSVVVGNILIPHGTIMYDFYFTNIEAVKGLYV
jgi:hypothetical protein